MHIGTELRRIRKTHRMTLAQVSDGTGVSISFLSGIERGRDKPSLDTLTKLAQYYNVPPSELLGANVPINKTSRAIELPGFSEFIEQMGETVSEDFRDLLLYLDNRARKPARSKDDWMRYYYLLSPIVA